MLGTILFGAYFVTAILCLIFSVIHGRKSKDYLYLYFGVVVLAETMAMKPFADKSLVYTLATFFYIAYFTYYYAVQLSSHAKLIIGIGLATLVSSSFFVYNSAQPFASELGFTISLFYIFLSLLWLLKETAHTDNENILQKQAFWISAALLVWSVIFLFRSSFMYWLAENDLSFLIVIDKIFKAAVVLTYLAFLVGVTRKTPKTAL
ncbi:hypothetical protein [Kaistella palustris]|uniref:hypothetical protein n=1 Tax=Kaistella palustris TaxID=493376 RepID=UPI000487CB54|nr:hypothetical protein [Kaistella palustris]